MSEEQVLPEFIATLKAAAEKATPGPWHVDMTEDDLCPEYIYDQFGKGIADAHDRGEVRSEEEMFANSAWIAAASPENILKLIAQSEAERERLREIAEGIERDRDDWARECGKVQIELARERELHQKALEVVRMYRETRGSIDHHRSCRFRKYPDWEELQDDRCVCCRFADALLEDKSKPVATTS